MYIRGTMGLVQRPPPDACQGRLARKPLTDAREGRLARRPPPDAGEGRLSRKPPPDARKHESVERIVRRRRILPDAGLTTWSPEVPDARDIGGHQKSPIQSVGE